MSQIQIRELADNGHIIGLHTHNHPTNCAALAKSVQKREYAENISVLEQILGTRPQTMAHPCGSYNGDTLDVLKDLGVKVGFRADMEGAAASLLEQPRMDHAMILKIMAQ
jgi:peptidoglycan/xylan/chitin deacetylase (PgdA/CDA1 family)